jgi:spore germination protein KB
MLEDGKISNRQLTLLIIITVLSTAILFLPTMVYSEAKQDSWLTMIPFVILGIIAAWIITGLGLMFKDKTIIQYSEDIVGKIPGKIIGLIYIIYFIHINSVVIREFAELFVGPFYPDTPILFFGIGLILSSIYAVRNGIEVISRVNEIFSPLFFIAIISLFLMVLKDMDFKNLTPVLAEGFKPIIKANYVEALFVGEIFFISMLIPYINIPQKVRSSASLAVIVIGLTGSLAMISVLAVFGIHTALLEYPVLSLARYISIADIIERMDSFIVFMWVTGVFVKVAVFHYCAVLSLAQWLNLRDYKPLVIPVGVIMLVLSLIQFENILEMTNQIKEVFPLPYFIIEIGIPAFLLLIAILRRKAGSI